MPILFFFQLYSLSNIYISTVFIYICSAGLNPHLVLILFAPHSKELKIREEMFQNLSTTTKLVIKPIFTLYLHFNIYINSPASLAAWSQLCPLTWYWSLTIGSWDSFLLLCSLDLMGGAGGFTVTWLPLSGCELKTKSS